MTVDGGEPVLVDLYDKATRWKQKIWDSGPLASGPHTVRIEWTGTKSVSGGGTTITVDAFDILGSLDSDARVTAAGRVSYPL